MDTLIDNLAYPQPKFPILPILSSNSFSFFSEQRPSGILDASERLTVISGTAAIALALQLLKIKKGDNILLPAFHCFSMVEPVLAMSAVPVYYNVNSDLSPDLDDIRSKMDINTRALLAVHYFGFPKDFNALRVLCDNVNAALIEDCAHTFFGQVNGKFVGALGDFAVGSFHKFFPAVDGGCLVSSRRSLRDVRIVSPGLSYNIKAALDILEEATSQGRLTALRYPMKAFLTMKNFLFYLLRLKNNDGPVGVGPEYSDGFDYLDLEWVNRAAPLATRFIVNAVSYERIAIKRREQYTRLLTALGGLQGGRPLFPSLPKCIIPYMFPFIIENPKKSFSALKERGVPIFRWEDMQKTTCPVSSSYAEKLLQFPCHQEMDEHELVWMIDNIRSVLES